MNYNVAKYEGTECVPELESRRTSVYSIQGTQVETYNQLGRCLHLFGKIRSMFTGEDQREVKDAPVNSLYQMTTVTLERASELANELEQFLQFVDG